MSDVRIVQCFGTKRRPKKPDKICRKKWRWKAEGARRNFGGKGSQACPHCGTLADFTHPINRYLGGELSQADAMKMMQDRGEL